MDPDGDGPEEPVQSHFVYQGNQIVLQLDNQGAVTNRYLWGPQIDQFLADEQVQPDGTSQVLWPLTDHLNTVRDLALHDPAAGLTTIVNHITYTAFGTILSQTNPTVTTLFAFTARPLDPDTGLQNNLNRWYDAETGRWISEDPSGFTAADANLYRYVGNTPADSIDPSGLWSFWRWIYTGDPNIADEHYYAAREAAGKSYSNNHARTAIRAGAAIDPTPVFGTVDSVFTGIEEGQSALEVAANIGLEAVPGPNPKKGKQAAKAVNRLADAGDAAHDAGRRAVDVVGDTGKAVDTANDARRATKATGDALRRLDDIPWGQFQRSGCEGVAKRIQGAVGGTIHRIKPDHIYLVVRHSDRGMGTPLAGSITK